MSRNQTKQRNRDPSTDQQNGHFDDWDAPNFLDEVSYDEDDRRAFMDSLSHQKEEEVGGILKGKVVEVSSDFVVVDVGLKSECPVPRCEFEGMEIEKGQEISVVLTSQEGHNGQMVLSYKDAQQREGWDRLSSSAEVGTVLRGKVISRVKGGLIVDIGIEAFVPASQVSDERITDLDQFIGNTYEFSVIKIDEERNNIVLSRRELLEEGKKQRCREFLDALHEGDVVRGRVKKIIEFGAFIDLGCMDGLLHIGDMAWKRVRSAEDVVHDGQEIDVIVLSINKEDNRLALGLKQLKKNPWGDLEERYPVGSKVRVRVVSLIEYGAFVQLEPDLEGLIHISEMTWDRNISSPSQVVSEGDEIDAVILSVQPDDCKISLGIKQLVEDPWVDIQKRYRAGDHVEGVVRSVTDYGVFVALDDGVEGRIRLDDLSWTKRVEDPSDVVKVGDRVKAVVLFLDNRKINLGIKQLKSNPWEKLAQKFPVGRVVKGPVVDVQAYGVSISLEDGLVGSVHATEISNRSFHRVQDVVQKGQVVSAIVIEVDPLTKVISLSMKKDALHKELDDIVDAVEDHHRRQQAGKERGNDSGSDDSSDEEGNS